MVANTYAEFPGIGGGYGTATHLDPFVMERGKPKGDALRFAAMTPDEGRERGLVVSGVDGEHASRRVVGSNSLAAVDAGCAVDRLDPPAVSEWRDNRVRHVGPAANRRNLVLGLRQRLV